MSSFAFVGAVGIVFIRITRSAYNHMLMTLRICAVNISLGFCFAFYTFADHFVRCSVFEMHHFSFIEDIEASFEIFSREFLHI